MVLIAVTSLTVIELSLFATFISSGSIENCGINLSKSTCPLYMSMNSFDGFLKIPLQDGIKYFLSHQESSSPSVEIVMKFHLLLYLWPHNTNGERTLVFLDGNHQNVPSV